MGWLSYGVPMTILAIDVGTTGVTALMVSEQASIVARGYCEFPQHFPHEGWVEHDPNEIWSATLEACAHALAESAETPTAIGITNQRETLVLWDRETLGAPMRAIVWQDRRTAGICSQMRSDGHEQMVTERTGLRLDPYFTGTKLSWVRDNAPHVWAGIIGGRIAVGTVDSYIIARLTRGLYHVTDASNASRTLLYNLSTGDWDDELCSLFAVPRDSLPEIVPSYGVIGDTDPACFFNLQIPIAGVAGDQQAALFGQACFAPGSSKCTYGTGSFVLVNTGENLVRSQSGLLTTVAWQHPDGTREFALEGAVFVTGSAVQWLRDGLRIIDTAAESEELALSVPDSGGVVFVPALTGLGAPDWDPHARGTILGISRGTTRAHIVRATLEAIAYEVRDVVDIMVHEAGVKLPKLAVDGGASGNNFLCQMQANQLQVPVVRPQVVETTGLGAAFLAGLGTGVWQNMSQLADTWKEDARFTPGAMDQRGHHRWRTAVERSKGWTSLD